MVMPFAAGVAPPLRGVISHAGAMQTHGLEFLTLCEETGLRWLSC